MSRLKTPIRPMNYAQAIKIVKSAKAMAKNYREMWAAAEEKNGPLWTENQRLRGRVRALESMLGESTERGRMLELRLDQITHALTNL